ncbi:MAG TPA: hypothetical protein VFI73_02060 [Candidatus Nitrosopolaris sp.]|nr:hypothetical protein [Candidatus Nitrosopolaris sp.]
MIKTQIRMTGLTIAAGIISAALALSIGTMSYAQQSTNLSDNSIKGALTSIQNDASTLKPAWIVSGVFRMDMMNTPSPVFNATFYMIKKDETASHQHTISDFKLNGTPTTTSNSTIFNGTSTVTMKNGPVKDVPTSISFLDGSAVRIWLDPSKTNNHFGNTAIYGTQHLICVEVPNYCK